MASNKRSKKIAHEGGYNFEHNNVHLRRKKSKLQLSKRAERRPQKKG